MLVLLCFRVAAVFSVIKDLYKTRRAMDVAPTASRNFRRCYMSGGGGGVRFAAVACDRFTGRLAIDRFVLKAAPRRRRRRRRSAACSP